MVSNIFYFHPYLGKWSNLTNIFQMGWSHQPVFDDFLSSGNVGFLDFLPWNFRHFLPVVDLVRVVSPPSGKWRFRLGSPTKTITILGKVTGILGRGTTTSGLWFGQVHFEEVVYSAADAGLNRSAGQRGKWYFQRFFQGQKLLRFIDLYSFQVSNEKNLGWLGYIGDYTTHLYRAL